jgi:hypothetical protein
MSLSSWAAEKLFDVSLFHPNREAEKDKYNDSQNFFSFRLLL